MKQKPTAEQEQSVENLLRNFGIKPTEEARETLRKSLFDEFEKFKTIERVHSRLNDRDVSR